MKTSEKRTVFFSLSAIIISLITLCKNCAQDSQLHKLQYEVNASTYKPIIKINSVTLTDINGYIEPLDNTKNTNNTSQIKIASAFTTKITFSLENIGNSNASIINIICIDTLSGNEEIRELIKKKFPFIIDSTLMDPYNKLQIQSKEIKDISFSQEVNFVENNLFIIHFLIIYKNDLGIYYDTYYWARFKKNDFKFVAVVDPRDGNIVGVNAAKKDLINSIKKIDDNNVYKIYSLKEKEELNKFFARSKVNAHQKAQKGK